MNSPSRKLFYCEICDHISTKHYLHSTHDRCSSHIQNCLKYKKELSSKPQEVELLKNVLRQKMNYVPVNINDFTIQIVKFLSNQRLSNDDIKEIRNRKKEDEQLLNPSSDLLANISSSSLSSSFVTE
jgi:hypothetical protein